MKSTDLRAKARAIFGPAIAEPMPNMPNGAKALQQRANARPIPTYKVGGVVKKADGGAMKPKLSTAERKMGDALMMTRKGKEVMAAQKRMEEDKEKAMAAKRAKADKLLGVTAKKDGGKVSPFGRAFAEARKAGKKTFDFGGKSYTTETREDVQKRAMAASAEREKRTEANRAAMRRETAAKVPAAGSKAAKAEELRMAAERPGASTLAKDRYKWAMKSGMYKDGGKVQTSSDTARKLAKEMGGMKKGGKAKDGLAVMIAIGKVKKPAKKAMGGALSPQDRALLRIRDRQQPAPAPRERVMNPKARAMVEAAADKGATGAPRIGIKYPVRSNPVAKVQYKDGGSPVKKAVGGTGKTRKGMMPDKLAKGGAGKVRKGMMSPEGKILQAVKPKMK